MEPRRCCTCKTDKPATEFTRNSNGKRCKDCTREAMRRTRARKRENKLAMLSAYRVKAPQDYPEFYDVLNQNLDRVNDALDLYVKALGTQDVIVPVDRVPETGYPLQDALRLYTDPVRGPCWYIALDDAKGSVRIAEKPFRFLASFFAEKYAVLKEPRYLTKTVQHGTLEREGGREPVRQPATAEATGTWVHDSKRYVKGDDR